MKKRVMLALVVSLVIFAAFYASAASLIVDDAVIQAGVDADMVCDTDGVFVDGWGYESTDQSVRYVRIGGIDAACAGLEIVVQVLSGTGGDLDTVTGVVPSPAVPGNDVQFRADFSPFPSAQAIEALHVAISN